MIILSFVLPVQTLCLANFIDSVAGSVNAGQNLNYASILLLLATILYQNLNGVFANIFSIKQQARLSETFGMVIIKKCAGLEYSNIKNDDICNLINRVQPKSSERIITGYNNIVRIISLFIQIVSTLGIIMAQVWWAALIIVVVSIPLIALSLVAGKKTYKVNAEANKIERQANYISSILVDRAFVEERSLFKYSNYINDKWLEKYESVRKANLKIQAKNFIKVNIAGIIIAILCTIIVLVLIPPLENNLISIGMFMSLIFVTFNLVRMISWQLSSMTIQLASDQFYMKDLSVFSSLSEVDSSLSIPDEMPDFTLNSIEFRDVSFKYPNTKHLILSHCSFRLQSHKCYALVGINGSGKTTITKLLTGLYRDYSGSILINDIDIQNYTQSQIKKIFAVVFQDFSKYNLTFKDNIIISDVKQENLDRMNIAINTLGLSNVVKRLSKGIETDLGKIKKDGVDLSGGEWQRLALARAIYRDSDMYILDEPTAALDPIAESDVYFSFSGISSGSITLLITHRLGAAKIADTILVLSDGRIAEAGKHDNLITENGIYAQMYKSQKSWYE
jgi:ATP-binding cassette subfamily B protein